MKNRDEHGFGTIEILIVIVVLAAIGFGAWYVVKSGKKTNSTSTQTTTPVSTPTVTTSEQPNKTKYNEFFASYDLAKLPAGQHISPPNSMPTNTTTFGSTDQLCSIMKVLKLIPSGSLSTAIYSVSTKQNAAPVSVFPGELGPGPGTSSGCGPLGVSSGKYEYKVYIDNVLIVDTPFTVQ